jgi:hypothetical protein
LASSTNFFENDQVTFNVTAGQSYLIRVYGGSAHPDYKLAINGPDATFATDFNMDGRVDGNDFLILQAGVGIMSGAKHSDGDADKDGDVDNGDFQSWLAEFSLAPAAAGQVASGAMAPSASAPSASQQLDATATFIADRGQPLPRPAFVESSSRSDFVRPSLVRGSASFVAARRPSLLLADGQRAVSRFGVPNTLDAGRNVEALALSAVEMSNGPDALDEFFGQVAENRSMLRPYLY